MRLGKRAGLFSEPRSIFVIWWLLKEPFFVALKRAVFCSPEKGCFLAFFWVSKAKCL